MAHSSRLRAPGRGFGIASEPSGSAADRLLARFVSRRGPIAGDHLLTRRNIYVLPSRSGILFALVLLAMLVCSINYGLAMGYALTFLIFGLAVVGMMHTFRNLSALTLRAGRAEPVYAHQSVEVSFMLINPSRLARFAVRVDAEGMNNTAIIDVPPRSEHFADIALPAGPRGWMPMPRLTLSTRYPLGIWRAWTYWQPAQRVLVYPAPETPGVPLPLSRLQDGEQYGAGGMDEDLAGIRPYRAGDSLRRIAWTAIARTGSDELLSKQFEGGGSGELLLDYNALPATLDIEARLSRLTRWVLEAEQSGALYALHLPGQELPASNGPGHKTACLRALASFNLKPASPEPRVADHERAS